MTIKLAYQLHEAALPTITAAEALQDTSTLITPMTTATIMVFYEAPMEEMQLATHFFIEHTQRQLTEALRTDKAAMLTDHADKLTGALKAKATRQEWSEAKTLMRLGGRPPRCGTEQPYLEDEHGNPIPDHEQQAEAELTYFAKAERSIFTTPEEICASYNQHALDASTVRALKHRWTT